MMPPLSIERFRRRRHQNSMMTHQAAWTGMLVVCSLMMVVKAAHLGDSAADNSQTTTPGDTPFYGVMLDAGSSSTKVKIFTYTKGKLPTLIPSVQLLVTKTVPPGLSDFISKLDELPNYLNGTLQIAAQYVPVSQQASSPVYLMATAGLRKLNEEDANQLLSAIRGVLADSSINPFKFLPEHVSILSGEEEAVYAWLSLNYLLGFFSSNMTSKDSVGMMEMGGGSMQVAFLPSAPLYQEEFQVYVGRERFDLYAQSYLDYGANYIRDRVYEVLMEESNTTGQVKRLESPCMLRGDKGKYAGSSASYIEVTGTSDPEKCEGMLIKILKPARDALCSPAPCAIGNRYQPDVDQVPFYAISAFVYSSEALHAIDSNKKLNISLLRENAWKHCTKAMGDPGVTKYGSSNCLMGLYIPQLLTRGLDFPMNTNLITATTKISNTSIDWATGAMLQQLSMAFMDDLDSLTVRCQYGTKPFPLTTLQVTSGSHSVTPSIAVAVALLAVTFVRKLSEYISLF
ncbi:ectonucleoside triphosphate diphosphohydrolase 5-like isoform X3 [Pomacea canaliculata]|uniref:ectonucleoside triphosphate diphosphohydrolase 5-like isoform X3 n=1 Tax=Pomacea canaliculata TaxID=400727 RepID=UPI000D7372B3|nr:ectonucleoside triphosphate diphosphohydrolase 5-like isoform X3 [Pomacea canaliculata]